MERDGPFSAFTLDPYDGALNEQRISRYTFLLHGFGMPSAVHIHREMRDCRICNPYGGMGDKEKESRSIVPGRACAMSEI